MPTILTWLSSVLLSRWTHSFYRTVHSLLQPFPSWASSSLRLFLSGVCNPIQSNNREVCTCTVWLHYTCSRAVQAFYFGIGLIAKCGNCTLLTLVSWQFVALQTDTRMPYVVAAAFDIISRLQFLCSGWNLDGQTDRYIWLHVQSMSSFGLSGLFCKSMLTLIVF